MEDDKEKPRPYGENLTSTAFNYYKKEMETQTKETAKKDQCLADVKFHLLQTLREDERINNVITDIADFYNINYIGNKDFIHIPKVNNIISNAMQYPIILATKKDMYNNTNILGVTTIKMENNKSITDNPHFPTQGQNILTINGILTRMMPLPGSTERIRNIGKYLFKSAIRGAYNINKKEKVRLVCEIDCRNKNSLKSIVKAVKELQEEGLKVQLFITGYYEIKNRKNELKEAPTFMLEIDLNGNKILDNNFVKFSYLNCNNEKLLEKLTNVIRKNSKELKRYINIRQDIVIYHKINPINALNVELEVGNSANGNERVKMPELYEKAYEV